MRRLLAPALVLAALGGCAAVPPPAPPVAEAQGEPPQLCERVARTGSSLPTTRCRTAEERRAANEGVTRVEEARRNFMGLATGK